MRAEAEVVVVPAVDFADGVFSERLPLHLATAPKEQ